MATVLVTPSSRATVLDPPCEGEHGCFPFCVWLMLFRLKSLNGGDRCDELRETQVPAASAVRVVTEDTSPEDRGPQGKEWRLGPDHVGATDPGSRALSIRKVSRCGRTLGGREASGKASFSPVLPQCPRGLVLEEGRQTPSGSWACTGVPRHLCWGVCEQPWKQRAAGTCRLQRAEARFPPSFSSPLGPFPCRPRFLTGAA